jgi:hypothetical protein
MKSFEVWTHAGMKYLSIPNGNGGDSVIAENGEHYGSWQNVAEFRRRQRAGVDEMLVLGKAFIRVVHIAGSEGIT